MKVQTVYVKNGKCIEEPEEVVTIMDFPQQLQYTAAVQFIYTAITEGSRAFTIDEMSKIYTIVTSINLANYIIPVFKEKNENARYLLSLELMNLFNINGIQIDQQYLYSRLFE